MSVNNFEELKRHYGHTIELVLYGEKDNPSNIAIECVDCNEVILDFNKDEEQ